jgi:rod shape-determining protein MreD
MNPQTLKRIGAAIAVVVLQVIFFRHLKIFEMQPDVVIIFLLWYMSKSTRTAAILMAAFLGFSQDALLDLWGLNMFAKILTAFLAHEWISSRLDVRLQLPSVITIVLIAALGHNLIFVTLSFIVENYTAEFIFWQQWIGNALYTTIIAGIIQLFRNN